MPFSGSDRPPRRRLAGSIYLAASRRFRGDDARRLKALATLAAPMVAANDVLYHAPERRALRDVMTAIRLR